jgi:hypothetical protein
MIKKGLSLNQDDCLNTHEAKQKSNDDLRSHTTSDDGLENTLCGVWRNGFNLL